MSIPTYDNGSPNKLLMIKSLRRLTIMLGKLGITCLRHVDLPPNLASDTIPYAYYGMYLKDAKDITVRFLDAKGITATTALSSIRITEGESSSI